MVKLLSFFQLLGIIALLLICGFSLKKIEQFDKLLAENQELSKQNNTLKSQISEKNVLLSEVNKDDIKQYKAQLAEFSAKNARLNETISQQENELQKVKTTQNSANSGCQTLTQEKAQLQKKYEYLLTRLSQAVKSKKIAPL